MESRLVVAVVIYFEGEERVVSHSHPHQMCAGVYGDLIKFSRDFIPRNDYRGERMDQRSQEFVTVNCAGG